MAAFSGVAVSAVVLLTVLASFAATSGASALSQRQRRDQAVQIAAVVADAYRLAGSWERVDLTAARELARALGAELVVVTLDQQPVAGVGAHSGAPFAISVQRLLPIGLSAVSPGAGPSRVNAPVGPTNSRAPSGTPSRGASPTGPARIGTSSPALAPTPAPAPTPAHSRSDGGPGPGPRTQTPAGTGSGGPRTVQPSPAPTAQVPVTVDGVTVGAIALTFSTNSLPAADRHARDLLLQRMWLAAGLAVLIALVVAALVSHRITRPVSRLAAVAVAVGQGRSPPPLPARAPGELGVLSRSIGEMLDTIRRQDVARRTMAADVAHELRTPLTVLRAETEGLVDGVRAPTPERLASLHEEVLRLGRIVDDLGTLAVADVAALELRRTRVDLAAVTAKAVEAMRAVIGDAGLSLDATFASVDVDADPGRLAQVVTNLLTNALKFTPDGGSIEVALRPVDGMAELTVSDTGPGIEPDELPHVFERFWRGRRSAGIEGSGVGLAVVKQIVEAHGGSVGVESSLGRGSLFRVRLPLAH